MNGFPGSSSSDFQVTLWQSDPAPKILGVWDHLEKCTIKRMTEGSSTFFTMILFSLHSDQARFCCRGSQPQWVAWMLAQMCWTWEICYQQSQGQSRFSQVLSDWLIIHKSESQCDLSTIDGASKYIVKGYNKHEWCQCVTLKHPRQNLEWLCPRRVFSLWPMFVSM